MTKVWFTSDTHYGHGNVIKYSKRPFVDTNDMDEAMADRWNSVVSKGDLVYHLGDFCLNTTEHATAIASKLRGQKYLIFGNHDKALRKSKEFLGHWIWAKDLTQIEVQNQKITLCHYAMRTWASSHHGTWQLYGHSHGSLPDDPHSLSVDVGVDCWDYTPISFEQLKERMTLKTWKAVDHHE